MVHWRWLITAFAVGAVAGMKYTWWITNPKGAAREYVKLNDEYKTVLDEFYALRRQLRREENELITRFRLQPQYVTTRYIDTCKIVTCADPEERHVVELCAARNWQKDCLKATETRNA